MINKKTLAVTALALLLSQQSFASEKMGFYTGGGYNNQFSNKTSALKITNPTTGINNQTINDRDATKTASQSLDKYKPDYNPPFAANIKFGYAGEFGNNSYRAELEGMYSSVKVDNIGLGNSQMTLSYMKPTRTANTHDIYAVVVDHDQIGNRSVMANIYHHWKNERFSFSPYAGVGIGLTKMKMFEQQSTRPAYQLKAGLDYSLTKDTNIHIGYRHFRAVGADIKLEAKKVGTYVVNPGDASKNTFTKYTDDDIKEDIKEDITIGNKLFSSHGLELGLTVHFASWA